MKIFERDSRKETQKANINMKQKKYCINEKCKRANKSAIFIFLQYENQTFQEMNMVAKFVGSYVGIAEIPGEEER